VGIGAVFMAWASEVEGLEATRQGGQ
jgi:hypothetical protein